jgi:hypothetical protein
MMLHALHNFTQYFCKIDFNIYQNTQMCAHVYQDTLHDFSPIGCLTKMTPTYVFPVFTKHATQMFMSGVLKHPTPGRPGDEISYQDA